MRCARALHVHCARVRCVRRCSCARVCACFRAPSTWPSLPSIRCPPFALLDAGHRVGWSEGDQGGDGCSRGRAGHAPVRSNARKHANPPKYFPFIQLRPILQQVCVCVCVCVCVTIVSNTHTHTHTHTYCDIGRNCIREKKFGGFGAYLRRSSRALAQECTRRLIKGPRTPGAPQQSSSAS